VKILATSVVLFLLGVYKRALLQGRPEAARFGKGSGRKARARGCARPWRSSGSEIFAERPGHIRPRQRDKRPAAATREGQVPRLTLVVDSLLHRGLEVTALGRTHSCSRCAGSIST
jgi:hypothetical protein